VHELFTYDLRLDPDHPPRRSAMTRADRFGDFSLLIGEREAVMSA
jgi:hypothetical protein